ncbi:MAG: DUF488 domain-containing protein [Enhydrobacter sp.]|nr:MAG: DUF488 domain-containing protein [Enhydrobacter sp.]
MRTIRTVGHSNHPIDRFVGLLEAAGVELLVDVRSTPYSRRFPQFGRERLAMSLRGAGIDYVHEGAALGGKPTDGGDYDALAARPDFRDALDRLAAQAQERTVCLMCAEKEPLACHRTVLVARRLAERGIDVEHLLADGRIEPHAALEEKVLAGNGGADLFDDRATRLAQAWRTREIAMRRG